MKLDRSALIAGIVTAVIISVPAALIGQAIVDPSTNDNPSAGALLLVGVVLFGLRGRRDRSRRCASRCGAPLVHGIVTAIVTFVLVQGIGVIRHIAANEDVLWSRVLSSALAVDGRGHGRRHHRRPLATRGGARRVSGEPAS